MNLSDFLECEIEEEEVDPNKVITFSDGEELNLTKFRGIATRENFILKYGSQIADKWWKEKVIKVKWNIYFEGLENTNLGG
jgi:hypothetical protein